MNRFAADRSDRSRAHRSEEATELAQRVDVILSCPPGFEERMRLNRIAIETGTPLIDAAQWGMSGTLIVVDPGRTACLECLYPEPPPFEELFPVVGGISSAIGALAALEAIKILSGCGQPMFGKMWMIDSFAAQNTVVELQRRTDCVLLQATPLILGQADKKNLPVRPTKCRVSTAPAPAESANLIQVVL